MLDAFLHTNLHVALCRNLNLLLRLVLLGRNHQLWADILVKVLFADDLELQRGSLQRDAVLVRILCRLAGGIVPNDGIEAGHQH